ncbi:MAG: hypothetical protein WA721_08550, partial [Candidatus Binataceae bacterium]
SSSGSRRQAGASCGSTRRIMTLFFFSTNFATLPVMAAMEASNAISGSPQLIEIVGYKHP